MKQSRTIIAIGGGEIGRLLPNGTHAPTSTLLIEQEIVRRAKKPTPRLLFIPTATDDHTWYCDVVRGHFGTRLGCTVDTLLLRREQLSRTEIEKKIGRADIIYVGWGNTLRMMTLWRRLGVDTLLRTAWERGTVMCGVSAGAICWFESGNSDSRKFTSGSDRLIRVSGLGLIPALVCPHYDTEPLRQTDLPRMMRESPRVAITLDNLAAIEVVDDQYRILSGNECAWAKRCFWESSIFRMDPIPVRQEYVPIARLLDKNAEI